AHRNSDPESDQVTDAEQREGEKEVEAADGAAGSDTKVLDQIARKDARGHDQCKHAGYDGSPEHRHQPGTGVLHGGFLGLGAAADLEYLGAGDPFGVGQVGLGHEGAPQGDRIHHTQYSAEPADRSGNPVRKAIPPADDHQAGQHENDRRQSAGGGGNGLDDIVLLDGHSLEPAQDGHGDDRRGDGGREGQPGLETEEDVGGGEYQGDQDPQDDAAERQFFLYCRGHGPQPPPKSLSRTLHRHAVPLRSKNGRSHGLRTGPVPVPSGGAVRCPTCYVVAQAPRLPSLSQGAGCWSLPQTPRLLSLPQPPRLASLPETPVLQKYA